MTLYLEEEGETKLPIEYETLTKEVVEGTLSYLNCPYEAELSLLLTDNAQIQQMNLEFREMDCATDVLSFPMSDYLVPGEFKDMEHAMDGFDPDSGELLLGDIVLSKDKVLEQADAYGHPIKREYAFLIVHSMLHLIGYDHIEEDGRVQMEELQERILSTLQIER